MPGVLAGHIDADTWEMARLSHHPKCTRDMHLVALECAPGYFGNPIDPFGIQEAYRDSTHTLVFMAFLREPVMRAHPHYYPYEEDGALNGAFQQCTPEQFALTFADAAHVRITAGSMCNGGCGDIFVGSLYVDFFMRYFKDFVSFSFHVVPFKLAVLCEVVGYAWEIWNGGHQ